MAEFISGRPDDKEYVPDAARYIGLMPEDSIVEALDSLEEETCALLGGLSDEQAGYRYAEGKWSLRTLVGHIADIERIWQYRLLRIARGDAPAFSGYERDVFAAHAPHETLPIAEALLDYSAVRRSTRSLLAHLREDALLRQGEFNGHPLSARAAAYIIAGHNRHHLNVIRDKYLGLTP